MMEKKSPKRRLLYVDALRGFAMLLVVYGHALIGLGFGSSLAKGLIYSFHMPLFFGISGFVGALSVKARGEFDCDAKWLLKFTGRKAVAILVPYVLWCVFLRPLAYGQVSMFISVDAVAIERLLRSVFVTNTALWFLPTLFVLSMSFGVYVYLCHRLRQTGLPFKSGVILAFQVLFVALALGAGNAFARTAMNYCLPYFIGVLAAEAPENFLVQGGRRYGVACVLFAAPAVAFAVVANTFGDTCAMARLLRFVAGVASLFVCFRFASSRSGEGWVCRILTYIGCHTLILYALGSPFFGYALWIKGLSDWMNAGSVLAVAFAVSLWIILPALAIEKLLSRIRWARKWLLGLHR